MPSTTNVIFPAAWRPAPGVKLVRVGPNEDGGYVIGAAALGRTKRLISGGLFDDWRFEAAFQQITGAQLDCYDPSVTLKFWAKRYYAYLRNIPTGTIKARTFLRYFEYRRFFDGVRARHHRAFIGYANTATDLNTAIGNDSSASTFLKIDIEGSEYRVLGDLITRQEAISGFVIEFHDVDLHVDRISRFIADAAPWFRVEHVHINNYLTGTPDGFPMAIELSFGRIDEAASDITATADRKFPLPDLDFPNNPQAADIAFAFA